MKAGNPYCGERISTVDLLVQTNADQLLLVLKLYISSSSFYKTTCLTKEVNLTDTSPLVRVRCLFRGRISVNRTKFWPSFQVQKLWGVAIAQWLSEKVRRNKKKVCSQSGKACFENGLQVSHVAMKQNCLT